MFQFDHPVCGFKVAFAEISIDAASTPPLRGGENRLLPLLIKNSGKLQLAPSSPAHSV
jgi:hypothetical protein